jgi:hypothetical protein
MKRLQERNDSIYCPGKILPTSSQFRNILFGKQVNHLELKIFLLGNHLMGKLQKYLPSYCVQQSVFR